MIIYNKTRHINVNRDIPTNHIKATRPSLTKENTAFLKLLKLKIKKNV